MKKRKFKKKVITILVALIASAIVYYLTENYQPDSLTVQNPYNIKCVDGDTFWLNEKKIRLLGVDSPEMTPKPEEYAIIARDYTCELLKNSSIIELIIEEGNTKDKYDRLLYWVELDGILLQESLVKEGLAEIKYINESTVIQKYLRRIKSAQSQARQERLNIWSQ